MNKRAELFEYFKELGNPKWVNDGQRLFDSLYDANDKRIDEMHGKMMSSKGIFHSFFKKIKIWWTK